MTIGFLSLYDHKTKKNGFYFIGNIRKIYPDSQIGSRFHFYCRDIFET